MKVLTGLVPIVLALFPVTIFVGAVARKSSRDFLLPGPTSAGHHQIEERCELCHTPFQGALDQGCRNCHGAALLAQNDSHAADKFLDPVRGQLLRHTDATSCVACHREHRPEARVRRSVSVAADFCFPCHTNVTTDRPSHRDFPPDGCADPGCHNYHDNRALNPELLARQRSVPAVKPLATLPASTALPPRGPPLAFENADLLRLWDAPSAVPAVFGQWAKSSHAQGGVNCSACHLPALTGRRRTESTSWQVKTETCGECHTDEAATFHAGKHGMRAAAGLGPLATTQARLPMKAALGKEARTLGCNSCHTAHSFDRTTAALEACEGCHDDEHTRAFRTSPHFGLLQAERAGRAPAGSGVSCASCHLPRREQAGRRLASHNQSENLHPADRMARDVCMPCHGLGFAVAALADPRLLSNNFNGFPVLRDADIAERK